jgi:hypothetical protein
VISSATYRLVEGLFECQDLGPQTLKGISAPMTVYRVVGEGAAQSRFEVAVGRGLTPLVGREEELGLLRRRWTQAKEGAGQVVLLAGEAGIGKSRLVQELKEQVSTEGAIRIEFRCSPLSPKQCLLFPHRAPAAALAVCPTRHVSGQTRQTPADPHFLPLPPGRYLPTSLVWALNHAARLHYLRREGQAAQERVEAQLPLSDKQGFPYWLAVGTILRGWALAEQGKRAEGISQLCQSIAADLQDAKRLIEELS